VIKTVEDYSVLFFALLIRAINTNIQSVQQRLIDRKGLSKDRPKGFVPAS